MSRRVIWFGLFRLALIVAVATSLALIRPIPSAGTWEEFTTPLALRGSAAEEYASLGDLVDGADLVVVGRITEVERGRELVAAPEFINDPEVGNLAYVRFALATVQVERVLSGDVDDESRIHLEMLVIRWEQVDQLQRRHPEERAIFFLHHKAAEADGRYYRFVNVSQGLVGAEAGSAVVLPHDHIDGDDDHHEHAETSNFLFDLDGRDFEEVVDLVVAEAGA